MKNYQVNIFCLPYSELSKSSKRDIKISNSKVIRTNIFLFGTTSCWLLSVEKFRNLEMALAESLQILH